MADVKVKKKFYKKWWFWAIIVVIIVAAIGGGAKDDKSNNENSTKPVEKQEEKSNKEKKEDTKVTYDNFLKVNMGAKYDEVVAILGEGKELSSSEIGGIKNVIYTWNGSGISNVTITIQNDEVTAKAQAGLGNKDAGITLDKYNQVTEGMTYDEVKAILGEGQLTSKIKIMDTESIIYSWINKDGSNANFTFSGDKLDMKAQFNLK
ncbi:DUF3862 domain-containing protein [Clostridium sp.]|uniref:DUF3862 domain-containing protein n=1 Tax=Clostridium sp. TaxID=1506 RepID=UPI003216714C